MKLRIATYNIHKGVSSIGSRPRVHALKQAIGSLDADVLFLQEVQGRHDIHAARHASRWPEQAQHEFLAGDSHHAVYGMNAVYDHGHHGNALLSRYPVAFSRNQDISDHAYESRGILHSIVQAGETSVHCFVVHLGLFAGSRMRQTGALIEAVEAAAPPGAPVIIAGDFNDWHSRLSDSLRAKLGVVEVFDQRSRPGRITGMLQQFGGDAQKIRHAPTFPAMLPCLPLDRIYLRGFAVEAAEVRHGPAWAKLSDHAPIVATVRLA
ncbi:MAG: endonuclease/exonuclease/phosphatase family protein [Burkholderiaceae bacterium]